MPKNVKKENRAYKPTAIHVTFITLYQIFLNE